MYYRFPNFDFDLMQTNRKSNWIIINFKGYLKERTFKGQIIRDELGIFKDRNEN